MIEEIILKNYGITVEREEPGSRYPSFQSGNVLYSIMPLESLNQEELTERLKMSEHLLRQGDRYVSQFVLATHGGYISAADDQLFLLLSNDTLAESRGYKLGRKLAKFHNRSRTITEPIKVCSRVGQWKELWEQRIDELENMYKEKLQAHPNNQFEKTFIDTFPYYMGLGENAIQYLVDTEIDDNPDTLDGGTVCYDRFSKSTWNGKNCIKNPFDWVFDHGSRDIAEWVREHYFENVHTHQPGISKFMNDYQTIEPLSSFSARLLYSRLLFPIHYFETAEEYFSNPAEARGNELEEKMTGLANTSPYYEGFLRDFYDIAKIPSKQMQLPTLGWM